MNYKEIKIAIAGISIFVFILNTVSVFYGGPYRHTIELTILFCAYFIVCAIEFHSKEARQSEVLR